MNFLIAFVMFYGIVLAVGVPGDPTTEVGFVVEDSPAAAAGLEEGDVIVEVGQFEVVEWTDMTNALEDIGPGETTVVVERDGTEVAFEADLVEHETIEGAGFLGVSTVREQVDTGPIESIGYAGRAVWTGIGQTFEILFNMFRPSSFAQYLGVFVGDTDVPDEIRPVSPIGIVSIGAQIEDLSFFIGILASVNVILATINLLPLFPLDGGHFAVALYEKVSGRQADVRRLAPIAAMVIGLFAFLGFVAIILDITNPINL